MTTLKVRAAACNMATLITFKLSGGAVHGAGFRITRIASDGTRTVLRSPTPFPGATGSTEPSDTWPIQKKGRYFDFQPALGIYQYEVALMVGQPGKLSASASVIATSNKVNVTTKLSDFISACFNWGMMSTQEISRWIEQNCGKGSVNAFVAAEIKAAFSRQAQLSSTVAPHALMAGIVPSADSTCEALMHNEADSEAFLNAPETFRTSHNEALALTAAAVPVAAVNTNGGTLGPLSAAVKTPGNELRERLACGIIDFLMEPMKTAKAEGGEIFDVSYEVTDEQWISFLVQNADLLSIILAEIGTENAAAMAAIKATAAKLYPRQLTNKSGIAHNKTQVRTDKDGVGQEVTSGAANKTTTGFCGQVSNAIRILSQALAAQYLAYFNAILADTNGGSTQGKAFRQFCNKFQKLVTLPDGTTIQAIFAPNTMVASKPKQGLTPGIAFISDIIDGLEDGDVVAGNFFIPGHPAVPDLLAAAKIKHPGIVMKVAVSDKSALPAQMPPTVEGEEPVFVVAQAIKQPFANLVPEILGLPGAHAFIHSKTVVIFKAKTKTWIVITGSHNDGEKADAQNDDNLLVISNCTLLGLAYFVNNFSVYDHFLFRTLVNSGAAGTGYLDVTDSWQTLSDAQSAELDVIMNALSSLDGAPVPSDSTATTTPAQPNSPDVSTTAAGKTAKKPVRHKPTSGTPKATPRCRTTKSTKKATASKKTTAGDKTKACPKANAKTKPTRKTTPRSKKK